MSNIIKYLKIIESNDLFDNVSLMKYHNYIEHNIPIEYIKFTNNSINFNYIKCNKCGMELLSGIEEIFDGYKKVIIEYYFLNNKNIEIKDFSGLTCDEVMIKLAVE